MTEWTRPADKLRDEANRAYARIRANKALTAEAKRAMIAQKLLHYKGKMAELETADKTQRAAGETQSRRKLFGIEDIRAKAGVGAWGSIDMSWRNAQDKAAEIKDGRAAAAMLKQAEDTGDELLARAVGNRMLTEHLAGFTGMDEPLTGYLTTRPAQYAALTDLKQGSGRSQGLAEDWEYVVPEPDELYGVQDHQVAKIAEQADALQGHFADAS